MTSTGQGWTLIARFSNDDAKNWMDDTGHWWYSKSDVAGNLRSYPPSLIFGRGEGGHDTFTCRIIC